MCTRWSAHPPWPPPPPLSLLTSLEAALFFYEPVSLALLMNIEMET